MFAPKLAFGLQGLGVSPCDVDFVGPLTEAQQAMCLAQVPTKVAAGPGEVRPSDPSGVTQGELANIKQFYYQAGQDATDNTPTYLVIGGALVFVMIMSMGKR